MNTLDPVDEELVGLLGENARQDSATLAEKLNVSAATVRRRLSKLLESDTVRIVGVVNPAKLGITLVASVITFNVAHEKLESVLESLTERPEIRWASMTTGRFDIAALGRFSSNDHLASFVAKELPKIEGIQHCETFMCLDLRKWHYIVGSPALIWLAQTSDRSLNETADNKILASSEMPDFIDRKLVGLLGENARQDSATLARKLNVSAATVRRRLSKLLESDTVRIVGVANPAKLGISLLSVITFNVTHQKLESVLGALTDRREIRWASITAGRFDIVSLGRFSSNDHLASFVAKELPKIEGIQHCETFICLDIKKLSHTLVHPF